MVAYLCIELKVNYTGTTITTRWCRYGGVGRMVGWWPIEVAHGCPSVHIP
jgi:hypothetical protein